MDDASREERRHIDQCWKEILGQDKRPFLMRRHRKFCTKGCSKGCEEFSALQVPVTFSSGGYFRLL